MELDEALSLIEYAMTRNEEELLFQRWINGLQFQVSYEEFKSQLQPPKKQVKKSEEEILGNVKNILDMFAKGR